MKKSLNDGEDFGGVVSAVLGSRLLVLLLLMRIKNEFVRRSLYNRIVTFGRTIATCPSLPKAGLFAQPVTTHGDVQPLNAIMSEDCTRLTFVDCEYLRRLL